MTERLRAVLAPALGPDSDEMEVIMTIGATVAQSRQQYEPFKFLVTEESKQKDEYFKTFGETVARSSRSRVTLPFRCRLWFTRSFSAASAAVASRMPIASRAASHR